LVVFGIKSKIELAGQALEPLMPAFSSKTSKKVVSQKYFLKAKTLCTDIQQDIEI